MRNIALLRDGPLPLAFAAGRHVFLLAKKRARGRRQLLFFAGAMPRSIHNLKIIEVHHKGFLHCGIRMDVPPLDCGTIRVAKCNDGLELVEEGVTLGPSRNPEGAMLAKLTSFMVPKIAVPHLPTTRVTIYVSENLLLHSFYQRFVAVGSLQFLAVGAIFHFLAEQDPEGA